MWDQHGFQHMVNGNHADSTCQCCHFSLVGSWHALYIVCTLESYQLMSEPYLPCGTLKNGATEPITQGLVRPCTLY